MILFLCTRVNAVDYMRPLCNAVIFLELLFQKLLFTDGMGNENGRQMTGTIDESTLTSPSSSLCILVFFFFLNDQKL